MSIAIVHRIAGVINRDGEFLLPQRASMGEVIAKKAPVLYEDYEHHPNRLRELDPYHIKKWWACP